MENPLVGVVMSSENELQYMEECERILIGFGIPYEIRVLSPHQSLDRLMEWARSALSRGMHVIIAGAGWAAHLPGTIAALTTLPVIGVPLPTSSMHGMDALLGVLQMSTGVPVATMAVGKVGAANAGILATQILGLKFPQLMESLRSYRAGLAQQVEVKDTALLQDRMRRLSGGA